VRKWKAGGSVTRVDAEHAYLTTNAADINTTLIRAEGDPRSALASVHYAVEQNRRGSAAPLAATKS